jgi:uncharacterized membrane protein
MDARIPLHLLHPMAVHFPIALLALGLLAALGSARSGAPAWLRGAAFALLCLGTAALWVALGLGLLAERLAAHEPAAWRVMAEHKRLAWISTGLFSALLAVWRWVPKRGFPVLLAAWALLYVLLAVTAHQGARLVFEFGVGSIGQ